MMKVEMRKDVNIQYQEQKQNLSLGNQGRAVHGRHSVC